VGPAITLNASGILINSTEIVSQPLKFALDGTNRATIYAHNLSTEEDPMYQVTFGSINGTETSIAIYSDEFITLATAFESDADINIEADGDFNIFADASVFGCDAVPSSTASYDLGEYSATTGRKWHRLFLDSTGRLYIGTTYITESDLAALKALI